MQWTAGLLIERDHDARLRAGRSLVEEELSGINAAVIPDVQLHIPDVQLHIRDAPRGAGLESCCLSWLWIPGSRVARPGMTALDHAATRCAAMI
jgi:hypothetical protein